METEFFLNVSATGTYLNNNQFPSFYVDEHPECECLKSKCLLQVFFPSALKITKCQKLIYK
jgi:hypothetical protein